MSGCGSKMKDECEKQEISDIEDLTKQFLYQFERIKEMRKEIHSAPVDIQGCAKLPENRSPKEHRFELLCGLMLSAQTKDEITGYFLSSSFKKFSFSPNYSNFQSKQQQGPCQSFKMLTNNTLNPKIPLNLEHYVIIFHLMKSPKPKSWN